MKILALETTAKSASVAVVENGTVLASAYQCSGLTHSRTLMPMVEDMLRNSELKREDLDAIAVAAGPGSFTGLRIGVSAAKGLAWALEKPCCAVSTLEGMAENLRHLDDALVICAMDARRNQVYNALFLAKDGELQRVSADRAIGLDELWRSWAPWISPKSAWSLATARSFATAISQKTAFPAALLPLSSFVSMRRVLPLRLSERAS